MRRTRIPAEQTPGQDSFLDIVANIVGILIILVMVVGVRAKDTFRDVGPDGVSGEVEPQGSIAPQLERAGSIQSELAGLAKTFRQIQHAVALRREERRQMELLALAVENELSKRRGLLDTTAREDFDLRRAEAEARAELDRLVRERISWDEAAPEPVQIKSRPTPLSQTVHGEEVHFQLRHGRVAHIPLDPLLDQFKTAARQKAWMLRDQPQLIDTVGPVGGFRMRYQLRRFSVAGGLGPQGAHGGSIVRLTQWELLPVSNSLGEPVDAALAEETEFRRTLRQIQPDETILTIWIYPDSFAEFHKLKEDLYQRGYQVAARPLPEGVTIGGSPRGSKSAAQ